MLDMHGVDGSNPSVSTISLPELCSGRLIFFHVSLNLDLLYIPLFSKKGVEIFEVLYYNDILYIIIFYRSRF